MKAKLIIKDGKVTVDIQGMKGSGCIEKADEIVKLLGKKTERKLKPQYYNELEVVQQRN